MTRKEQILQAARDYVSGVTLSSPSDVIHFEYGARWADEHPVNVWHDASEEPKDNSALILYQYKPNRFFFVKKKYKIRYYGNWKNFVRYEQVIRWIYVKDLFQKEVRNDIPRMVK